MPSLADSIQIAVLILDFKGFDIDYIDLTEGNIYMTDGNWVRVKYHNFLDFIDMDAVNTAGYTYIPLDKKNTYNGYNPKPLFYYAFNLQETYSMVCDVVKYESTFFDQGADKVCPIGNVQFLKFYEDTYARRAKVKMNFGCSVILNSV